MLEFSFFSKMTTSKFTAKLLHPYMNEQTQKTLRPSKPDECILYYI